MANKDLFGGNNRGVCHINVGRITPEEARKAIDGWRKAIKKVKDVCTKDVYADATMACKAMRRREEMKKRGESGMGTTTLHLDIDRFGQSIFKLKDYLTESQAQGATVVLNGTTKKYGVDYTICDNTLNWLSGRTLGNTDALIIRYPHAGWSTATGKDSIAVGGPTVWVPEAKSEPVDFVGYSNLHGHSITANEGIACTVTVTEDDGMKVNETSCEDLYTAVETEEEEMIEPGVKVWHRMTNEGPWIVIQSATLRVRSSQRAGGEEQRVNDTFVESAWTVQTDEGIEDYPEVVLTTKRPRVPGVPYLAEDAAPEKGCKGILKRGLQAAGIGALAFGVIHAQWIYQMVQGLF